MNLLLPQPVLSERNYNIGNWELLVVKLALEEWRHWLEGAKQPFMVWTDQKFGIHAFSQAVEFQTGQVGSFFNHFDFSLSY